MRSSPLTGSMTELNLRRPSAKMAAYLERDSEDDGDLQPLPMNTAPVVQHDACTKCGEGGTVLCCDYCSNIWHLYCLPSPLDEAPIGMWSCPNCGFHMCIECRQSDAEVACYDCKARVHAMCITAPTPYPGSTWRCHACLDGIGAEKIVAVRPAAKPLGPAEQAHVSRIWSCTSQIELRKMQALVDAGVVRAVVVSRPRFGAEESEQAKGGPSGGEGRREFH